ncbi:hypothetical protein RND81_13G035300 [Saponaria officinalis]|uniref:MULE transposase domain-containing protein n=1 Tax=Saponaria officinalis TaxID=3572 RepID=A0AAW1GTC5_SAPOF
MKWLSTSGLWDGKCVERRSGGGYEGWGCRRRLCRLKLAGIGAVYGGQDEDYFEEFPDDMVDTSHIFTGYSFKSRKELISETRRIGLSHNIHIRLYTYFEDRGFGEQWLWCDRSRPYQYRLNLNASSSKYLTGTKKCLCPFRLKGIAQPDGTWKLFVHNGVHNHKLVEKDEILNDKVKEIILRMTASQVPVANILIELANQNYKVTKKQVYNVRAREKTKLRENRTSSEQLLKFSRDHGYLHFHQTIPGKKKGTRELPDVLFAHPDSIILLKHYSFVLLADCTYQTNKYKMPLLEIIGVTPVNKNFSVFYGFLENEKETAYDWAFKCIREVLDTYEKIVFVTDREKALINAIENYFPNAIDLLCRRHTEKDVEAWVKKASGKGSTDCCVELDSVHQFWKTLDIKTSVKEGVAEKEVEEEERLRKLVDEVIKGGV